MMFGILENWYVVDRYGRLVIVDILGGELIPAKSDYLICGLAGDRSIRSEFEIRKGGFVVVSGYEESNFFRREYKLGMPHHDYKELLFIYNDVDNRTKILTDWSIDNDGVFSASRYNDLLYIARDKTIRSTGYGSGLPGKEIKIHDIYHAFHREGYWIISNGRSKNPNDKFDEDRYYVIWANGRFLGASKFNENNSDLYLNSYCCVRFDDFKDLS